MKSRRFMIGLVCALAGGCATAPEPVDIPVPGEPPPPRREVEPPRTAALQVGVVLSTSGSATLQRYGELVLEGVRLGADAAGTTQRGVELVIRDDGGTPAGAARAVRELEQAGMRVIVGPLTEQALLAAAQARTSDRVILISPMAVAEPAAQLNTYALNVVDARGADALGEYARRYARVGVLYSRTPDGNRLSRAFVEAYGRGGHGTVREAPFAPGATNLSNQLTQLLEAQVEAIYFPGTDRELQVVLPQVEYFGLAGVQMLGNEAWISDAARGLPPRVLQGAIVATPLWRDSDDIAWRDFVSRYEAQYRRSLDNPVPALGYDAVLLAARLAADANAAVSDFRGATGVISLRDDAVTRRPFLVRIDAGRLVPLN
jgi:ABC-type branched-subunit amino acid transport system substrate-binding protein